MPGQARSCERSWPSGYSASPAPEANRHRVLPEAAARIALIISIPLDGGAATGSRRAVPAGRAGVLALIRIGPIDVALCPTGSEPRGPASHRAATGPGRD